MDISTFNSIKSLIMIMRNKERWDEYNQFRKAYDKMAKKLKRRGQGGHFNSQIRKYFGLCSEGDWWHLLFRTDKGTGAYLFLRLVKERKDIFVEEPMISDFELWNWITDPANQTQAYNDANNDTKPPADVDTEGAENDIGPLPFPPSNYH